MTVAFLEPFQTSRYVKLAGITLSLVQDDHARSKRDVLRGLHSQKTNPQGKLVRTVRSAVYDVAVDIREHSVTYGQWEGVSLSEEKKTVLGSSRFWT